MSWSGNGQQSQGEMSEQQQHQGQRQQPYSYYEPEIQQQEQQPRMDYQQKYSPQTAPQQQAPIQQQPPVQQPPPQQHTKYQKPPPVYTSPRGMFIGKLCLRAASITCAIIVIAITASIVHVNIGPIVFLAPPAGVAIIWSAAEAICLCVRGGHRGIHPGACVALDLLLWLGLAACCVLYGLIGYASPDGLDYGDYCYYEQYGDDDGERYVCEDDSSHISTSVPRAALSFAVILLLIHFTLFVIACTETSIRNGLARIVYVQAPPGMMLQPMALPAGYQQIPAATYAPSQMAYPQQTQYVKPTQQYTREMQTQTQTPPRTTPSPVMSGAQ